LAPVVDGQQQKKVWRLGLFHVGLDHLPGSLQRLKEGLRERGFEEGKNIQLDWRNLPDDEAARKTTAEFVQGRVDLIVAFENQTIRAVKAVTSEMPVVFLHATDPVADGYVKSLAQPFRVSIFGFRIFVQTSVIPPNVLASADRVIK